MEEVVSTKRPRYPFKDLDGLTQKVSITPALAYDGTSQDEVLHFRQEVLKQQQITRENKFLKLPDEKLPPVDPDFKEDIRTKSEFKPWQLKILYQMRVSSSSSRDESSDSNDDTHQQPYKTPTLIQFNEQLKHIRIDQLTKKSAMMVTSTMSMSLYPKDERLISRRRRQMDIEGIAHYVDQRNAFNALAKKFEND